MGIVCQNSTLWSWGKYSRTKTIDLEISLLHHGIFVMIPLSTLTEKSKLNVEYRSQLLFGFQINFSVFYADHPLDNIPSSWIKGNTTPRVTSQRYRPVPSLQLDQQNAEWSKMVETSSRTQHTLANVFRDGRRSDRTCNETGWPASNRTIFARLSKTTPRPSVWQRISLLRYRGVVGVPKTILNAFAPTFVECWVREETHAEREVESEPDAQR